MQQQNDIISMGFDIIEINIVSDNSEITDNICISPYNRVWCVFW